MQQWRLVAAKQLELVTEAPSALTEEVNVKVKMEQVLFSKSDYGTFDGSNAKAKFPFVMGVNGVGVVSEIFENSKLLLNKMDRVVVEPYIPCNACNGCLSGEQDACENMLELGVGANGLLQNFIDLPSSVLHVLPDSLSSEKALFVPYVALGLNVMDKLKLAKGSHVAVFASSKTGVIAAQLLNYYQAVPILVSENEDLLAMGRETGIFYTFNPDNCDIEKEVQIITGGRMCREVIYFANSEFNMKDVYNAACFNATICLVGYSNKKSMISVSQIAQKHITINGVYAGIGNFPSAINMLVTGKVNVDKMIGDKLRFDKLDEELQSVTERDVEVVSKIIVID
jgi:threonine dehydrogenase-like Zn-dependent dehydrogenase